MIPKIKTDKTAQTTVNLFVGTIGSKSLTETNQWHYTFGLVQKLESTLEPAGFSHAEFQDRDDRSKGYSKYRNGLKGLEKQRSGNWKRTAESG